MAKKSNSAQETSPIFHQDMTAGPSEMNLQSSIGSHAKQTQSKLARAKDTFPPFSFPLQVLCALIGCSSEWK